MVDRCFCESSAQARRAACDEEDGALGDRHVYRSTVDSGLVNKLQISEHNPVNTGRSTVMIDMIPSESHHRSSSMGPHTQPARRM